MVVSMFWLWIGLGLILCFLEVLIPTAFVEMMLGVSALLMALVSLLIPNTAVQIVLWLLLSVLLIYLIRRFFPHRKALSLEEAVEAQTLTAINPGKTGRVLYEGNSWQARCEDHHLGIAENEAVYVVRREGTTLIVIPQKQLDQYT
ncbi:NfeD family protein [Thermosynechococcaceae cyanobacterium BACA0444]|uniref:NfeD family protein n=1 Tax=Pseudocalidococcus azoricus BACA0444 TaxID=2918990 RepID=A0AAE4FUA3_9CYAN|nr:NfeD family protein [Pseudocalidococcus azoricus]MDS3862504.1 NfeD family protein [Pseudocalidococcus azoricus BACA0444]